MTHVTVPPPRTATAITSEGAAQRGLLRFITCGSVDDGKSTLIGRLLADTGNIAEDQVATLRADSRRFGTQGGQVDYALLLDGLAAEREQGITIDVAHRYFSTPRRSFIVADTPGHRQYTRNMATGASMADLAVVLVDARQGVLEQTRRHTLIVTLLGVRQLVLAVNKMDLVGYDPARFAAIDAEYRRFVASLDPAVRVTSIPLCARDSQNLTSSSDQMPWYSGPTLLTVLETVDVGVSPGAGGFRFPVQLALRPNAEFRGFAGQVAGGQVQVGDRVTILPSGEGTTVARIVTASGDVPGVVEGQSVTLVLADALDVARGDMIVGAGDPATVADRIEARVLWSSETPLDQAREYALKLGTATVAAKLQGTLRGVDVATGAVAPVDTLALNTLADVSIRLDRRLAVDLYAANRRTGGFVLIDTLSHETVAMGIVRGAARTGWLAGIPRAQERVWRSVAKAVTWRLVGTFGTVLFAFLFTRDARIVVGIGGLEVLTKIALFYVHERAWARVPVGFVTRGDGSATRPR